MSDDPRGAEVVVLAGDADLTAIRDQAPAAAVLVVGDAIERRCGEVYETTLFPRARVIGIPDPERLAAVVESIIFERGDEHDVIAMTDGEFGPRPARLGRGGIRELL